MATIFSRGARRRMSRTIAGSGSFCLRSYLAAVACTTALSSAVSITPAVAQEAPAPAAAPSAGDVLDQLSVAMRTGSVSGLAGALADVQAQVSDLESRIGQQREAVNKALVDLQDARTELKQAQQGAQTAHDQLEQAQKAVEAAQAKLDELSRASYRRANTAGAVTAAAGSDARSDALARQAFLRSQAADQQAVVDQLEADRTEKANKEAQLKQVEQLAKDREQQATQAESDARSLLETSQDSIAEAVSQRDALVKQQQAAQTELNKARGVANGKATSSQSTATNTAANVDGHVVSVAPNSVDQETVGATNDVPTPDQVSEQSAEQAASQGVQTSTQAPSAAQVTSQAAAPAAGAAESGAHVENPSQAAAPAVSGEQLVAAGSAAARLFDTAASMVASTQPDHTDLDGGSLDSDLKAIQNVLTAVGDSLGATTAGTPATSGVDGADATDTLSQLSDVLGSLDTSDTVTQKASKAVASQGTNAQIEAVIARAESQIGVSYAWGGGNANGPTKGIHDGGVADSYGDYNKVGFDCSGLTLYAFAAAGISLPHYTGYQYNMGTKVDPSQMKRGDLIFYGPGGSQHVAIYLGDGTMIEAPESGSTVRVSPVRYSGMSPQVVRLIG